MLGVGPIPAMQGEEGFGEENLRPRKAGSPPHAIRSA
jgi:hypothetical protein